ncbi:MAG: biopolymer transporter ExbD [Saprospiraceae bacterium]
MQFEKKRGKAQPAISTASLPDIIFMLLFFFMVVTVLRDTEESELHYSFSFGVNQIGTQVFGEYHTNRKT